MSKVFLLSLIAGITMFALTTQAHAGDNPPCLFGSHDATQAFDVVVNGSVAYVADRVDGLLVFDVSDPRLPILVGTWNIGDVVPGATPRLFGIEHVGTTVYLADFTRGLQIIDASDPTNPILVGSFDPGTFAAARSVEISGNTAYLATGFDGGLKVVDITNPAAPTLLTTVLTPGDLVKVTVVGNLAYLSDRFNGMWILDITNPAAPAFLGVYDTQPVEIWDVEVVGSFAIAPSSFGVLKVVDVSNPAAPTLVTTVAAQSSITSIDVSDSIAYVITAGGAGVLMYDLANPASPQPIGSFNSGMGSVNKLAIDGTLAYLADFVNSSGLRVMDLTGECAEICLADLDENGIVNIFDLFAFIAAFNAMDPVADFIADGVLNINDLFEFIAAFNIGCP